jgi:hypothetical protein
MAGSDEFRLGVPSGSPPSAWKAKGELEGVVVNIFLFPFQQGGDKGDGIPIKDKVGFS